MNSILYWRRNRSQKSLVRDATKYVFQQDEDGLALSAACHFLAKHKWASQKDMFMALELAASQAKHEPPSAEVMDFYEGAPINSDCDLASTWLDLAEKRASVALAQASMHLIIRRQAPEYSFANAVYNAEKFKGARLSARDEEKLRDLTDKLATVEKQLHAAEAKQEADREVETDQALSSLKPETRATKESLVTLYIEQEHPQYTQEAVHERLIASKGDWLSDDEIRRADDLISQHGEAIWQVLIASEEDDPSGDQMSILLAELAIKRVQIDVLIEGPFTEAEREVNRAEIRTLAEELKRSFDDKEH